MKRQIRQRCGFGCVICGLPLYEYEHMDEWAKVQRHEESEITLLCDRHHTERTKGLLPIEDVRKANADPCNLRTGISAGYDLHYSGDKCDFVVGGCTFEFLRRQPDATALVFVIRNIPLLAFTFEDGQLLLTIQVFNSAGDRVLCVDRGELIYRVDTWDVSFVGQVLTVREGKGKLLFEVRFAPPDRVEVTRAYLQVAGHEVLVTPDTLYYLNAASTSGGCHYGFSHAAIVIDRTVAMPAAMVQGVNAYFQELSRDKIIDIYREMGIQFALDDNGRFILRRDDSEK